MGRPGELSLHMHRTWILQCISALVQHRKWITCAKLGFLSDPFGQCAISEIGFDASLQNRSRPPFPCAGSTDDSTPDCHARSHTVRCLNCSALCHNLPPSGPPTSPAQAVGMYSHADVGIPCRRMSPQTPCIHKGGYVPVQPTSLAFYLRPRRLFTARIQFNSSRALTRKRITSPCSSPQPSCCCSSRPAILQAAMPWSPHKSAVRSALHVVQLSIS